MKDSELTSLTLREIKEISSLDEDFISLLLRDQRKSVQAYARQLKKKRNIHLKTKSLYDNERSFVEENEIIAGIDEVGRGPIAGPVLVGCCVFPTDQSTIIDEIDDSKKLSAKKREILAEKIKETAIDYSFGMVSAKDIDRLGINVAVKKAMNTAVTKLELKPDLIIIDEPDRGYKDKIIQKPIKELRKIKADETFYSVAAASIIAKVYRDSYMTRLAKLFPEYHFETNKGYGTKDHIAAIKEFGLTPIHRSYFCKNFIN